MKHPRLVASLLAAVQPPAGHSDPGQISDLTGTRWAASYYHEDWDFISADTVVIRSGQWGWSMPADTSLISRDSLYVDDSGRYGYRWNGLHLIVADLFEGWTGPDTLTWDGGGFLSNWIYAYGHVNLVQGGNEDCRMHGQAASRSLNTRSPSKQ
ncbi:MAG: hypothetical protein ABI599_06615 [Flavobacteriales bacterium]